MQDKKWRIEPRNLTTVKNLLEGYDNLALMTTIDAQTGIFEIKAPRTMRDEAEKTIEALIWTFGRKES